MNKAAGAPSPRGSGPPTVKKEAKSANGMELSEIVQHFEDVTNKLQEAMVGALEETNMKLVLASLESLTSFVHTIVEELKLARSQLKINIENAIARLKLSNVDGLTEMMEAWNESVARLEHKEREMKLEVEKNTKLEARMAAVERDNAKLSIQVADLQRRERMRLELEADIQLRQIAVNIEKWIAKTMGEVHGPSIDDLCTANDTADKTQWKYVYRMHLAYIKKRMDAIDMSKYESIIQKCFPGSGDIAAASEKLANHIKEAKGDGNQAVHPYLPPTKMMMIFEMFGEFIPESEFWKPLVDQYVKLS